MRDLEAARGGLDFRECGGGCGKGDGALNDTPVRPRIGGARA